MFTARRYRHHARATAQRSLRTQQDRAAKTSIAADQQHVTELAFVGSGRAAGQTRQIASRQATRTDVDAIK
ncbi:hypothetical protein D3C87_1648100 [compost metagenome]